MKQKHKAKNLKTPLSEIKASTGKGKYVNFKSKKGKRK